jgi:hypothetical protein
VLCYFRKWNLSKKKVRTILQPRKGSLKVTQSICSLNFTNLLLIWWYQVQVLIQWLAGIGLSWFPSVPPGKSIEDSKTCIPIFTVLMRKYKLMKGCIIINSSWTLQVDQTEFFEKLYIAHSWSSLSVYKQHSLIL